MPAIPFFSTAVGINVILAYIFALLLLYLVARLVLTSFRRTGKFFLRAGAFMLAIIVCNGIGKYWGYHIPLNLVTILLPALLGFPGFLLVALLQFLFF